MPHISSQNSARARPTAAFRRGDAVDASFRQVLNVVAEVATVILPRTVLSQSPAAARLVEPAFERLRAGDILYASWS
jgi:hypothetical protein